MPVARLLFAGLRRAEGASLLSDDVDFWLGVVGFPAARTQLNLPMSDVVRDRLVARPAIGRDGPFVFPSVSRSGYLSEPKVGWAPVVAATGIKVSVHELRRSFFTVAESTEMSPCALRALVNHSLGGYRRRHGWLP